MSVYLYVFVIYYLIIYLFQAVWRFVNVNGGVPLMANPSVIAIVWMVYSLPLTYLERMADARQLIQTEVDGISEPELITFLTRFVDYVNSTWFGRYMPEEWNHSRSANFEHITNNAAGTVLLLVVS